MKIRATPNGVHVAKDDSSEIHFEPTRAFDAFLATGGTRQKTPQEAFDEGERIITEVTKDGDDTIAHVGSGTVWDMSTPKAIEWIEENPGKMKTRDGDGTEAEVHAIYPEDPDVKPYLHSSPDGIAPNNLGELPVRTWP